MFVRACVYMYVCVCVYVCVCARVRMCLCVRLYCDRLVVQRLSSQVCSGRRAGSRPVVLRQIITHQRTHHELIFKLIHKLIHERIHKFIHKLINELTRAAARRQIIKHMWTSSVQHDSFTNSSINASIHSSTNSPKQQRQDMTDVCDMHMCDTLIFASAIIKAPHPYPRRVYLSNTHSARVCMCVWWSASVVIRHIEGVPVLFDFDNCDYHERKTRLISWNAGAMPIGAGVWRSMCVYICIYMYVHI